MAAVQKILLLIVAIILLIPSATSKSPESNPANEKGHCNSHNDPELSSGSQPQSCSTPSQVDSVDASSQEEDQQDHAIDQAESILTMSHASQSSEGSSSTKSCSSSSNSEDCEAEDHPILMTEHFSSSTKTESAFDHEANDQPQAGTQTVITEPPSLYLLIQEPLNVLERIDDVKAKFVNQILNDKLGHKVKRIIADHPLCQHCQVKEIFRDWLQGYGMTPVTWNTLIDTLRRGRLHTLADDIYSHVSRNALFLLARPDAHWQGRI